MDDSSSENKSISINISLISDAVEYYSIIGVGFGLLTLILINRFAGGGGLASGLFGGLLVIIVYAYTGLTGPILATVFGYNQFGQSEESGSSSVLSNAIANMIGYISFGAVVVIMSIIAISLGGDPGGAGVGGGATPPTTGTTSTQTTTGANQGSGGMFSEFISFVILMSIPSGFVGGAMTYVSDSDSKLDDFEFNNKHLFGVASVGITLGLNSLGILIGGSYFSENPPLIIAFLLMLSPQIFTGAILAKREFEKNTVRKYTTIYAGGLTIVLLAAGLASGSYGIVTEIIFLLIFVVIPVILMYVPYSISEKIINR